MACLINTNVLIYALNGGADSRVMSRIEEAILDRARYSVITRMEILG